jgi:hypothetical protein
VVSAAQLALVATLTGVQASTVQDFAFGDFALRGA